MRKDIKEFVKCCQSCALYKIIQKQAAGKMLTRIAEQPWETLCADFIGPLPRSKRGHTMLLVFIDKFSKWVELVPLRRATAETLKKAMREVIISRFGIPKVLIYDNGTQFTSRKFQVFLNDIGAHAQHTAPYTPQENPTEIANRTIKTSIAQLCGKDHITWYEYISEIALAINSSLSESTNYSPAYLMQGRELRLPEQMYDKSILRSGKENMKATDKADHLNNVFSIVRRNLEKSAQKQAQHYNLRRRKWQPQVGQLVLVKQHHLSKAIDNFSSKLAPNFEGPFQVWHFKSPVIADSRWENTCCTHQRFKNLSPAPRDNMKVVEKKYTKYNC